VGRGDAAAKVVHCLVRNDDAEWADGGVLGRWLGGRWAGRGALRHCRSPSSVQGTTDGHPSVVRTLRLNRGVDTMLAARQVWSLRPAFASASGQRGWPVGDRPGPDQDPGPRAGGELLQLAEAGAPRRPGRRRRRLGQAQPSPWTWTRASRRTVGLPRFVAEELAAHLTGPGDPDALVFTAPRVARLGCRRSALGVATEPSWPLAWTGCASTTCGTRRWRCGSRPAPTQGGLGPGRAFLGALHPGPLRPSVPGG
jgi:hypothetical protein